MKIAVTITLALALLVGLTIGALGGGGSVLTLPIFVYLLGIPAQQAIPMSMLIVGSTSFLGALLHYYYGHFHTKATLLFAVTGMMGAFLGSFLTNKVSQPLLMLIFATLMLTAGIAMLRTRGASQGQQKCHVVRCLAIGAGVGTLTGFLGIGGGFMIVPALVLFAGIPTKNAMGVSLAVITLNSAAGLMGLIQHTSINWKLTLSFLGLALIGMLAGIVIKKSSRATPSQRIRLDYHCASLSHSRCQSLGFLEALRPIAWIFHH
ncbi:sulfite exporter TauE/SafE family protein [Nitrosococcus wardiae]|uniref:Probable membrane transporter protein n=1 Tax=Nitrosococcus wardiae TaxID=1814290 RepID=A0A4P7C2A0_9GAMM|nr:sulfite exporter TauE/SafE family protein [Nitrosococcus wardiae]QBQ55797.1 sulfite exporter TauE/SafE family protein [Nitrosococcus wardiae]